MRIKIFDYTADGSETLRGEDWLDAIFERDDPEYEAARSELMAANRCWVGGGAAPLVLLIRND